MYKAPGLDYAPPSHVLDAIERPPSDCPLDPAPVSTVYSADVAGVILDQLADGKTLADICQQAGYPRAATVRRWAVDDVAGFAARYHDALVLQAHSWADEIIAISDGVSADDDTDLTRDRLRVESRKWLMSKAAPGRYGDSSAVKITGSIATPISNADELRAKAEVLGISVADLFNA